MKDELVKIIGLLYVLYFMSEDNQYTVEKNEDHKEVIAALRKSIEHYIKMYEVGPRGWVIPD